MVGFSVSADFTTIDISIRQFGEPEPIKSIEEGLHKYFEAELLEVFAIPSVHVGNLVSSLSELLATDELCVSAIIFSVFVSGR